MKKWTGQFLFFLAIVISFPLISKADGSQLLEQCVAAEYAIKQNIQGNKSYIGRCFGMIEGVRHSMILLDGDHFKTCFPEGGINNRLGIKIVINYLENHPDLLKENETQLILLAYQNAYPCQ